MPLDVNKLKLGQPAQPAAQPEADAAAEPPTQAGGLTGVVLATVQRHVAGGAGRARSLDAMEEAERADMQRIADAFAESARKEAQGHLDSGDTEFWIALGFQSRTAKEEFLRRANLIDLGDKYLCGEEVAERLGIALPEAVLQLRKRPVHARIRALIDGPGAS